MLKQTTTEPPGRKTRAISATARGARRVEPVERLGAEDTVDRLVGKRDLLGGARERLRIADQGAQRVVGLHSDDTPEVPDEEARQFPGAGREVEHLRVRRKLRDLGDATGPARPPALVVLGRRAEAPRTRVAHANGPIVGKRSVPSSRWRRNSATPMSPVKSE